MGFGVSSRPVGAFVIREGDVRWQPALGVWVKDGPHCIIWTHSDEVNAALLDFLKH